MTDGFLEKQFFCHAALAVSKTLLLHKQWLCKHMLRLGKIVCAEEVSCGQHCARALNELCPCRLGLALRGLGNVVAFENITDALV